MITTERKEWIINNQRRRCAICGKPLNQAIVDYHHKAAHNTKANQSQYPFMLNSVLNLVAVCRGCHDRRGNEGKASAEYLETVEALLHYAHELFVGWPVDERALMAEIEFIRRDVERGINNGK